MKTIILCLIILSGLCTSAQLTRTTTDTFARAELPFFVDSLKMEQQGEFPSKWKLEYGSVEIASLDGVPVVIFLKNQAKIAPLMDRAEYLPESFTIEFDAYFWDYGNEGYTIIFDRGISKVRVSINTANYKGELFRLKNTERKKGWKHVALSFNKRALKLYMDGERVFNIPQIEELPGKFSLSALSHGVTKDMPAALTNVAVYEGGVPLYDRLMSEGRIVTRAINFEINSARLKPESSLVINKMVTLMKNNSDVRLKIEGHTDSDGTDAHNLQLSAKRADAVKQAMIDRGIDGSRLESAGLGESAPVDSNDTKEGKAMNRRVEFILL